MNEHDGRRGNFDCRHCVEGDPGSSLLYLLDRCGHYFAHRIGGSRRGQGQVLTLLAQGSEFSQKELAERLGVIPSSLSEVLAKMERKGLVERRRDKNDRRILQVHLTPAGERTAREMENLSGLSGDLFQVLSQEEQATLSQLLTRLLADWETRCAAERKQNDDCTGCGHGD